MKIIVDGMPRTVGGIGSLILNIADTAKIRGDDIDFEFIISDHSAYTCVLDDKNYRYYIAPRVKETKKYKAFLISLFNNNNYEYLWFNNTSKVNILLPQIAKEIGGAKIITHPHGVDFEEQGIKRFAFKILDRINERRLFSLVDVPFACSNEAADIYYRNSKRLRAHTRIIQNGIFVSDFTFSIEKRNRIRDELGCSEDTILLGAVGRLTQVKNYPFLIDLLTALPEEYRLIIIGEGEDYKQLYDQVCDNKLEDRCALLGKKSNVSDYLCAMDYFVMPSFNEGMPYSIIEAQTNGLRSLVSDRLSQEIKITELVEFLPIDNKDAWVANLKSNREAIDRTKYPALVKDSGYSIEDSYNVFYQSVLNGNM